MGTTVCEAVLTRDFTPEGAGVLSGEDAASYLAVLVRLAAVDGLDVEEVQFVHRAAACVGLQAELADIAGQFVADPGISSASLIARIRDPGLRLCLLRDAYRLAAADGIFSDQEIAELADIAGALGVDRAAAVEVRSIALQEARLHREFASMVRTARS